MVNTNTSCPNFLLAGFSKCGTTSLWSALNQHPKIVSPASKEMNFTNDCDVNRYFSKMPEHTDDVLVFEASPSYSYSHRQINLIKQYFPNVKIVLMVRDPVDRFVSGYIHFRGKYISETDSDILKKRQHVDVDYKTVFTTGEQKAGLKFMGFTTPINGLLTASKSAFEHRFIESGKYINIINGYVQMFGSKAVHVCVMDDFINHPTDTFKTLFDFLEIEFAPLVFSKENSSDYWTNFCNVANDIQPNHINLLMKYYKDANRELFKFLNKEYEWK